MKTAIIGIGNIAPIHLEAILEAGGEITALCDINPLKAEDLKNKFGLQTKIFSDFKTMLEYQPLDIVHICTPHYLHEEMILEALKRNINVLSEKPLCIHTMELENIKETISKSRAKLGICLQNRYLPVNQYAHHFLEDKKILTAKGKVIWRRDVAYYKLSSWRGKLSKEGGGVMINQAIHTLDLLLWFCGMPEKIKGRIENVHLRDVIEVETNAEMEMTGKYQANFYATTAGAENFPIEIEIETEKGKLKIIGNDIYINDCFVELPNPGQVNGKPYWGAGHKYLIKDFHDSVIQKRHFPININEAEKAMKIIWALYRSQGKEIIIS